MSFLICQIFIMRIFRHSNADDANEKICLSLVAFKVTCLTDFDEVWQEDSSKVKLIEFAIFR